MSATTLRVPALNEHREDIPDLVNAIATLIAETSEVGYREFDVAALNALRNADWSGNLAQLDNVTRNLVQTSLGKKITLEDVKRVLAQFEPAESANKAVEKDSNTTQCPINLDLPLREARDEFERLYFNHYIQKTGGNMSKVAELVQLERTHLYRKLKQLGIKTK